MTRSETSVKSSASRLSQARVNAALAKLQAEQAARAADRKAKLAEAEAQAAEAQARAQAQAAEAQAREEAQQAADRAELQLLELRLLEEELDETPAPDGDGASPPPGDAAAQLSSRPQTAHQQRSHAAAAPQLEYQLSPKLQPVCAPLAPRESVIQVSDRTRSWIQQLPDATAQPPPAFTQGAASALPRLQLESFDGSVLEWPRWSALFKALVHQASGLSDAERMAHLQSCLRGEARDAVRGLLCDGRLYGEALRELERRFGDPARVVAANLKRVFDIPAVKEHDIEGLSLLSSTLHCTVSVLQCMGYSSDLDASSNLRQISGKLPATAAWDWGKECQRLRLHSPSMVDLDGWLRAYVDAGRIAHPVVASRPTRPTTHARPDNVSRRTALGLTQITARASPAEAVNPAPPPADGPAGRRAAEREACAQCGDANHDIASCGVFAGSQMSDRLDIVRRCELCLRCLRQGHKVRQCPDNAACTAAADCEGRHHPLLHGAPRIFPTQRGGDRGHVGAAAKERSHVALQITPVIIHGPRGQRAVNAIFDLGSQLTLVESQLALELGLDGPTQQLSLGTVDGSATRLSKRVNFQVQGRASDERHSVTGAWTTPGLHLTGSAVNWPERAEQWPHLQGLELPAVSSEAPAVLLGADVLDLIVPREIREGSPGTPTALNTKLGWLVTGKVSDEPQPECDTWHVNHLRVVEQSSHSVNNCRRLPKQTPSRPRGARRNPFPAELETVSAGRPPPLASLRGREWSRRFPAISAPALLSVRCPRGVPRSVVNGAAGGRPSARNLSIPPSLFDCDRSHGGRPPPRLPWCCQFSFAAVETRVSTQSHGVTEVADGQCKCQVWRSCAPS